MTKKTFSFNPITNPNITLKIPILIHTLLSSHNINSIHIFHKYFKRIKSPTSHVSILTYIMTTTTEEHPLYNNNTTTFLFDYYNKYNTDLNDINRLLEDILKVPFQVYKQYTNTEWVTIVKQLLIDNPNYQL